MDSLRDTKLPENVKREIGQHFIFGFHGHEVSPEIEALIRHGYLNNVILMKRNIKDAAQTRRVVRMLQQIAKEAGHERPLMIGIDQENGLVSAFSVAGSDAAGTQFPGAMALAATRDTSTTEEVYRACAEELKLVGINWAFSPVADVNSDQHNPVIGARSFGDDPKAVGQHVFAATRGLSAAGVAASLKHFPGHGATATDSHLALPVISRDLDDLKAVELVPFAASLSSPSIMTGHIALPALDDTEEGVPASLSARVTSLLRNELEYSGVIVTDCLEMEAVAAREGGVPRGAVQALQAGADIVMICHTAKLHTDSLEAAYKAVKEGELDIDALRASGRRIADLKDRFAGSWADVLPKGSDLPPSYDAMDVDDGWASAWADQKALSASIAKRAYASTTAIIRDPHNHLQRGLMTSDKVLLVTPTPQSLNLAVDDSEGVLRTPDGRLRNTAGASFLAFAAAMQARLEAGGGALTHVVVGFGDSQRANNEAITKAKDVDRVVYVTRDAHRSEAAWQKTILENLFSLCGGEKLSVVSTCAPYDVIFAQHAWTGEVATLATFEFTAPALEAAVAVLFKEKEATGKTPVAERYVRRAPAYASSHMGQAAAASSYRGRQLAAGPRVHHHNFRPLQQPAVTVQGQATPAPAAAAPPPAAQGGPAGGSEELRAAMATLIQAGNSGQGPVSPEMAQQLNLIMEQMNASQSGTSGGTGTAGGSGSSAGAPSA
ncbi:glycoside hydrolase family 3 protein [Peniophora sp. CONT]|nr:glycoside hydrolase family 3 protein [Peniophora sp. CONT]